MAGPRADGSSTRRGAAAVVGVAVVVGLAGLALAVAVAAGRPSVVTSVGRSGDLTVEVSRAEWVTHDMDPDSGMPMDGMPAKGHARLHLEVTMANDGAAGHPLTADQFRLDADEQHLALVTDTFGSLAVGPGQSLSGDLFFDVPEDATDHDLRLEWRPPGRDVQFRLHEALGAGRHRDDAHDQGEQR